MLIRAYSSKIVDDSPEVIVITRPRRFGKTLNLSMLYYFLDRITNVGCILAIGLAFCGKQVELVHEDILIDLR